MIFDTHAHYDDEAFDQDREELIESLPAAGIETVVNVGASLESTKTTLALAERYSYFYGAAGVHPTEPGELTEADMEWLKEICGRPKVVAVGEVGLDYHWDEPERDVQKKWFARQLELAREVNLPVIIHSRDAAKDTLDLMKGEHAEEIGGVIHCFSYGVEMAAYAPLDRIVLETDCPYLAPVPNRGKRNSSLNLSYVADALAQIKGVTREEIEIQTCRNARRLYRLEER